MRYCYKAFLNGLKMCQKKKLEKLKARGSEEFERMKNS
jgi:hypothetical protein